MKAITYRSYGGPEVLEYSERPEPSSAPTPSWSRSRRRR